MKATQQEGTPENLGGSYRLDIQGLRAVAVLAVIAFHAGLPLPGGFTGVDMFFVVSGFVITSLLSRELSNTGRLRLGRFYLRRFKRLTPALALVVGVTAIASSLLLLPFGEQQAAAKTGLGSLALVANYVIASLAEDYFGPAAKSNPLLHTWSLSVEEQFYLVFPLLLLAAALVGRRLRHPRATMLTAVMALLVGSLIMIRGAALGVPHDSWLLGFYSPLNRAWEFAVGALVALAPLNRLPRRKAFVATISWLGLALLMLSMVWINEETPFPGKWTLVPVLGTALLIVAGTVRTTALSTALTLKPVTRVGDWSYSLYLWHWPCIVFAQTLVPGRVAPLLGAAFSFVPAIASYRLLETPLRQRPDRPIGPNVRRLAQLVVGATALCLSTLLMAGLVWAPALAGDGWLATAYPPTAGTQASTRTPSDPGVACEDERMRQVTASFGLCRQSRPGPVDIALIGDSHAEVLFPGFLAELPELNTAVYTLRAPDFFATEANRAELVRALEAMDSVQLVIVSRAFMAEDGLRRLAHLEGPIHDLVRDGKHVLIGDDVPDFNFNADVCRYRVGPVVPWNRCTMPAAQAQAHRRDVVLPALEELTATHPRAAVLPMFEVFCTEADCSMIGDGQVLFSDSNHVNPAGSRYLVRRLLADGGQLRETLDAAFGP